MKYGTAGCECRQNGVRGRRLSRRVHHGRVHEASADRQSDRDDAHEQRRVGQPRSPRFPAREPTGDEAEDECPEKAAESHAEHAQDAKRQKRAIEPEMTVRNGTATR